MSISRVVASLTRDESRRYYNQLTQAARLLKTTLSERQRDYIAESIKAGIPWTVERLQALAASEKR